MTKLVKKIIASIICLATTSTAIAQTEWVFAASTDTFDVFVDITSIKRDDDMAFVRELTRYKEKNHTDKGTPFETVISKILFDCKKKRYSVIKLEIYDDYFAKDNEVLSDEFGEEWTDVEKDSVVAGTMRMACRKIKFRVS